MLTFEDKLQEYARLVVEVGANVQEGKPVRIRAGVEVVDFVHCLVKAAYGRGASDVIVVWSDDVVTRERYLHAGEEALKTVPDFVVDELTYYYEKDVSVISVYAEDPDLLAGVDPERIRMAQEARSRATKHLMHYTMKDVVSWTVVSVPTIAWAKRVFPEAGDEEAKARLWEDIFSFVRIDQEDPVQAWKDHLKNLEDRCQALNAMELVMLRYRSENGTDLEVGLPEGHKWLAASSVNAQGVPFIPNMPTEEIYTAPDYRRVTGRLKATRPLVYHGVLIEGVDLTYDKGNLVSFHADKGMESLEVLLKMDEGASRLGEVALVAHNSPISQADRVYYNTLFDENASCHFAFGKAYPTCLEGGEDLDDKGLLARGLNDSVVHEDFMVGSDSLEVVGVRANGEEVSIMMDGIFVL